MTDKCRTFVARWDHAMCSTCGEEHDRPAPRVDVQPPPVLDLDALEAHAHIPCADSLALPRGDALCLIADARAAVALRAELTEQARKNREALRVLAAAQAETERLRAQICRLVSGQAIESDRLCQHLDADVAALAKLAEAKRLGLEAVQLAHSAIGNAPAASADLADQAAISAGHSNADRLAAALEAL